MRNALWPGSSSEAELILACARTRIDDQTASTIKALLEQALDWAQVLRTAELQKVTPLLHSRLATVAPGRVPEPFAGELGRRVRGIGVRNLVLAAELQRLLPELAARGIPAIPFKGPALAVAAYGNLGLRQFGDLDILVRGSDTGKARELLESLGFRLEAHEQDWEYHFIDHRRELIVDLHERLASRYFPVVCDFESLYSRLESVRIGAGEVAAPPADDSLLVLCIHLGKDCREWKETLSEVCDIAALVESSTLNWAQLQARARAIGGERLLHIGLWLARDLLGTRLPEPVASRVERDATARRLGRIVKQRLMQQLDGSTEFVKFRDEVWHQDSRFHLGARERIRDKVLYLRYYTEDRLRLLLAPSERDRRFLRLPDSLGFLYYLIRPVRIARDKIRAGDAGLEWPPTTGREPRRSQ